jgi:CHASE2 domain-containing sensor protein
MTTITTTPTTDTTPTTSVRAGLALSALIGLGNLPLLSRDINWGEPTPPYGFLVLAAAIGMVSVVGASIAWNSGNRRAIRIDAAALIVNALMVVPGFFVDLTPFMTVLSAVFVIAPVAAVVLIMRREQVPPSVID